MKRLKSTGLFLLCLCFAVGLLDTAITMGREDIAAGIFGGVCGLIMLLGAAAVFLTMTLPAWRSKGLARDMADLVMTDQSGAADKDQTDRLLTSFRRSLSLFFSVRGTPEDTPLRTTATQILWHILSLQKRRMDRLGVTLEMTADRRSYGGVSVTKQTYFDGRYYVTDAQERIAAARIYRRGAVSHTIRDNELAHCSILYAKRQSDGSIICPNCGSPSTREQLLDGCPSCGTKFTVEDLGWRVSSFTLREDYQVAYDKYRDRRRVYAVRAFLAVAVPTFVFGLIGMFSVRDQFDSSFLMAVAVSVLGAAFTACSFGALASLFFMTGVLPFIQAKQSAVYLTRKKMAARKLRESMNDTIEKRICLFDRLFSIEGFFSNIQNKLAAIHYADRVREVHAFAPALSPERIASYRDVVDMDVSELELLDYRTNDNLQYLDMRAALRLVHARDKRFVRTYETIRLSLEKSAACKTEAVCAPSILTCRNCGASLSLLDGGRCAYCGSELKLRDFDWVITGYDIE